MVPRKSRTMIVVATGQEESLLSQVQCCLSYGGFACASFEFARLYSRVSISIASRCFPVKEGDVARLSRT